jgi:hypothetical protein
MICRGCQIQSVEPIAVHKLEHIVDRFAREAVLDGELIEPLRSR